MGMFNRLKEPSTWAGIAVLLQISKKFIPAPYLVVIDTASAVAGALAGMMKERGKPVEAAPVVGDGVTVEGACT